MKPQLTNNIGFFKGFLLLVLFAIPYVGPILLLLLAIFNKGEIGGFARAWVIVEIVFYVILVVLSFVFPEQPLTPDMNDGVQAFISSLVG